MKLTFEQYCAGLSESYIALNYKHIRNNYNKYLRLSKEDIEHILELQKNEGKEILYHYGKNKVRKMILTFAQTTIKRTSEYHSFIYDVRLNYINDGKKREWSGFWTNKIHNIEL